MKTTVEVIIWLPL
jgi:hypothetical protein